MAIASETPVRSRAAGRALDIAGLVAILCVGTFLRLHGLADDSFWRDEATSWAQAQGSVIDIISATAQDNYPPLHNLILAATMRVLGDSEWALRLPSVVFGVLNIAALYWVGTMLGGRVVGCIAALLLALSAFHIWYSQEARMYALLALTATLYAGATLAYVRRTTRARTAAVLLAGIALLYTHPYGAFAWLSITGAATPLLSTRRGEWKRDALVWLALQAVIVLAFLPWAVVLAWRAHTIGQSGFWIPPPTVPFVTGELTALSSGTWPLVALVAAAALAFVSLRPLPAESPPLVGRAPPLRLAASPELWIVVAWLVGPIIIGVAISSIATPIFYARYVIGSLPALLLLASLGLGRLVGGWPSAVAAAVFALIVSVLGLAYGVPPPREDWRDAIAVIRAKLPADGCVLVPDSLSANVIAYYMRPPPACLLDAQDTGFDPSSTTAHVALATVVGSRGGLVQSLPPPWVQQSATAFRGIEVVVFTRTGA